jgi:tetratricopeptide (TPR) repeat protein
MRPAAPTDERGTIAVARGRIPGAAIAAVQVHQASTARSLPILPMPTRGEARGIVSGKPQLCRRQTTFDDALQPNPNNPARLLAPRGAARGRHAGGDSLLRAALNINPEYVDAPTQHGEMLLDLEDFAGAQADIDRALKVNPSSEHALAVAAAIKYLTHDQAGFDAMRQRALALNAKDAELYSTLAELAAQVRLYKPAAEFAKQGVTLDPKNWHAWSVLGMNQLRLGQITDGRKSLETSFTGDPYNVWVKNTLDLLDTYKNYDLITSANFQFMIEDESPVLRSAPGV